VQYDTVYAETKDFFGTEPARVLAEQYTSLNPSLPVLDLGAGQGRHTLFLGRLGYEVDAVDSSQVGAEMIAAAARDEALRVRVHHKPFEQFVPPAGPYGGILLLGIMQDLTRATLELLVRKVEAWTVPGSMVFVTTFTTEDPSYEQRRAEGEEIGKHSYRAGDGRVHTYLEPGEILELFAGYRVLFHEEGLGPEHRHGDGPPERHARAEAVFVRIED
jgi:cyclopropane fatty-acyl-phospholipid synthase-like methyltransferase